MIDSMLLVYRACWDTAMWDDHSYNIWRKGPKFGLLGSVHYVKVALPGGMLAEGLDVVALAHSIG
jgi:hypothetical protein